MKIIAFDIETADADQMHHYGPGFIRLCGWKDVADLSDHVEISTDAAELAKVLLAADAITAHNGINYDIMALAVEGFVTFDEYERLCLKSLDTLITARHLEPVAARGVQPNGYYQLDSVASRYGAGHKASVDFEGKREILRRIKGGKYADKMKPGKTETFSVLDVLKGAYGGYDQIPQDDPDYIYYLRLDVLAQAALCRQMLDRIKDEPRGSQAYIRDEHRTGLSLGRVTLEGSRVNNDLTMKRWSEGQARLDAGKRLLHEKFGMPLEGKKPHTTNAGKAAFKAAILATGISEAALEANWPLSQDGFLLTGKEVLNGFIPIFERTKPEAAELCRTILAMNGERSIYGTILDHLIDGKVHPYIGPDQSSGRWSMKDPGLTVFGKRGGKARERAIILADTDDEVVVAIDADQVDARVVAAECQDRAYMQLFSPGVDLHSEVAYRVWPSEAKHGPDCHQAFKQGCDCGIMRKCHCERRDHAKVFGHGFSYGLGPKGMAAQHGVDIMVAQTFVRGMTEAFPRLAEWKDEVRVAAGALGRDEQPPANDTYRILHTWAGRPVRVERTRAYTQATALIGQGGTRDVMARAIRNLPVQYRRRVRAVIHDEIILSLPKADAQQVAQGIADSMAFDLKGVQITFGCSRVSPNWAGCYGEQYETAA